MVDIVCITKQSVWIEFSSFKDSFSWQLIYLRLSVRYLQGLSLNFAWPTKSSLIPGRLQTLHWPLLLLGLHWMLPIFLLWLDRWKCLPALCVFWVLLRLQFSGHSLWSFMGIHSPHEQTQWRLHTGCRSSFSAQCLPFQNSFLASAFLNYNLCFLQLSKAILTCLPPFSVPQFRTSLSSFSEGSQFCTVCCAISDSIWFIYVLKFSSHLWGNGKAKLAPFTPSWQKAEVL